MQSVENYLVLKMRKMNISNSRWQLILSPFPRESLVYSPKYQCWVFQSNIFPTGYHNFWCSVLSIPIPFIIIIHHRIWKISDVLQCNKMMWQGVELEFYSLHFSFTKAKVFSAIVYTKAEYCTHMIFSNAVLKLGQM
jgi:hypothetical protein